MGAQQVVDQLSTKILAAADSYKSAKKNPELFFQEVETLLEELVDFRTFASGVMGRYTAKSAMAALSPAERKEREQQVDRFAMVFRTSLVQAYGNAFLSLGGKVQVETVGSKKKNSRVEDVVQKVSGITERPVTVRYRMMRDNENWRLHNIAIEKINLGKLYRGQFGALADKYNGNLNRVIDEWSAETKKEAAKEQPAAEKKTTKGKVRKEVKEKAARKTAPATKKKS